METKEFLLNLSQQDLIKSALLTEALQTMAATEKEAYDDEVIAIATKAISCIELRKLFTGTIQ